MRWDNVRLGDVCTKIGSGATPKGGTTVYTASGTSFIRSQNVYNLSFCYDGLAHITEEAAKKLAGVTVLEKDILINITGDSVARTCVVPANVLPSRVSQHVSIIRPDPNIINPYFLNYYLASPYMQAHMLGLAVGKGSSRNAMTKEMIADFKVPCPPINVQNDIVKVLSKYDSLIETNHRQIKLLEEAAQRLYKEWFVDLRFPGHENVPVVDGMLEGWVSCTLDDVIDFNPKVFINKDHIKQYVPMAALSTQSMIINPREFTETITTSGSKFQNGDTLLARITPCLENGKTGFVAGLNSDEGAVGSTEFIVMRSKKLNPYMVYLLARTDDFRKTAINSMTGSDGRQRAQPDKIRAYPFLLPPDSIIASFGDILKPIFDTIQSRNQQDIRLSESRDRLLPKLMSGEIAV